MPGRQGPGRRRGRRGAWWWSSRGCRGGATWSRGGCGRSGARMWSRCTSARRAPNSPCSTPTATPPTLARCTSSSSSSARTSTSTSWVMTTLVTGNLLESPVSKTHMLI
ncbi:hypothetical protein ACQ4PT_041098 [Festuca glaucescens]